MPGAISIAVFAAIFLIATGLIYALSGGSVAVSERLGRLSRTPGPDKPTSIRQTSRQFADKVLAGIARYFPASGEQAAEGDPKLIMAGFRRPEGAVGFTSAARKSTR